MSLDIYHYHLTKTPNNLGDFFGYLEDWEKDCNVPLKYYEKYITDIEDTEVDKHIIIIKNEDDLNKLIQEKYISENDIQKYFIGNLNWLEWESVIMDYIKEKNIENVTNRLTVENDGINYITIPIFKYVTIKGMYYNEIGYQSKSMGDRFYNIFKKLNYNYYGNKEDFELAYECIGDDWYIKEWGIDYVNEIKTNFKEDFIDKYIFGTSIMSIGF